MNKIDEYEFTDLMSPIEQIQGSGTATGFAPHMGVQDAISMAPYLRGLSEYQMAQCVLIVDDGVALPLIPVIRGDRKPLYCLNPHDGTILSPQYPDPRKYYPGGFPPQRSFARLPQFDLVLTGCHGIAGGRLYTSGPRLIGAFSELEGLEKIDTHTCVVAMVNQYQHDHQPPYDRYFARARWTIVSGMGVTPGDGP